MRIDGGLSFVTGPMGAGKSLFEVRHGVAHMLRGGWWITNVPLYGHGPLSQHEDALWRIAFHVAPASKRKRARVHARLAERYRYTEDLHEGLRHSVARHLRKPGHALARLGWDESLSDLNAREWAGGRGKTADDRAELFDRVPMLRKNGVAGFLLVQHEELLDKNARRIANWNVRLQNQRENTRILGCRLRFLPPLFLAYWYQGNQADRSRAGAVSAMRTERYPLSWHRHLYDTLGLYGVSAADDEAGELIWLGSGEARRLTPRNEAAGALPQPADQAS